MKGPVCLRARTMHTIEWCCKQPAIACIAGMMSEIIAQPQIEALVVWNFSKSAPPLEHSCLQRDL
jgi:hypothetical protein